MYAWLGVKPPRGLLLHGPPGCGKTALANAIANKCGVPFLKIAAPEIVSGMSGGQLVPWKQAVLSLRGYPESSAEISRVWQRLKHQDAVEVTLLPAFADAHNFG